MVRLKRPDKLKGLSFNRMIPNILTLLALCAGVTSMRFGLHGEWERGVAAIAFAAVLDGIDGRIARLLRGTTKFGAELDSLSDFVSFGVAPAMLLYLWTMQNAGGFGWALVLLFSVCAALRLARFNTMLGEAPPWAYNFFTGMPTPAAALLVLLPMMAWLKTQAEIFQHPGLVSVFLIGISFLMVSQVPTYSFKRIRVPHRYVLPMMLVVGLLAAFLVTEPWITISIIGVLYLASIPTSMRRFVTLRNQAAAEAHAAAEAGVGTIPEKPES
ncbi:MAG: CDP-diacylglycerol--serine O-phosphatidyltransferase [Alphaproteobacteria bacterium]